MNTGGQRMDRLEDCPEYIDLPYAHKCRRQDCEPGLGCILELERIEKEREEKQQGKG